jgi:hypothetical protein
VDLDEVLAATFSPIAPHLTERQLRLLFGAAAQARGYGDSRRVARLAEASRPTVRRGAAELDQPADPRGRIEHRLFRAISMNCRGRSLTSHEVLVER